MTMTPKQAAAIGRIAERSGKTVDQVIDEAIQARIDFDAWIDEIAEEAIAESDKKGWLTLDDVMENLKTARAARARKAA